MKRMFNSYRYATRVSGGNIKAIFRAFEIVKKDGLPGVVRALKFVTRNNSRDLVGSAGYKSLAEFPWVLGEVARASSVDSAVTQETFFKRLDQPVFYQYGDKLSIAFERCIKALKNIRDLGIVRFDNSREHLNYLEQLESNKSKDWLLISDGEVLLKKLGQGSNLKILDNKKLGLSTAEVDKLTFHLATSLKPEALVVITKKNLNSNLNKFVPLLKLYTSVSLEKAS